MNQAARATACLAVSALCLAFAAGGCSRHPEPKPPPAWRTETVFNQGRIMLEGSGTVFKPGQPIVLRAFPESRADGGIPELQCILPGTERLDRHALLPASATGAPGTVWHFQALAPGSITNGVVLVQWNRGKGRPPTPVLIPTLTVESVFGEGVEPALPPAGSGLDAWEVDDAI